MKKVLSPLLVPLLTLAALLGGAVVTHHATAQSSRAPLPSSAGGIRFIRGTVDPTSGAGVQAVRPAVYVRMGTDTMYLKTGTSATAWSLMAMSNASPTFASVSVTGNVSADRFLASSLGTATDPSFSWVAADNDGEYNSGVGIGWTTAGIARGAINEHHLSTVNGIPLDTAGRFVLEGEIVASITADQNNYAPSGYTARSAVYITPDAARSLTGYGAPPDTGSDRGTIIFIHNDASVAGRNLTLVHESASSDAGNRFTCPGGANVVIPPGGVAMLIRRGNAATGRWRASLVGE